MKMKTLLFLVCLLTPGFVLAQSAPPAVPPAGSPAAGGAPDPEATQKPLQVLKPGVVASFGRFTNRGKALSQGTDGTAPGEKAEDISPVTGSVKKFGSTRCAAVMTNNSDTATFSVGFELSISTKETVKSPKKKYFSAVLGPKKSVEREFRCDPTDILQMALKSGKEIR